MNCPTKPIKTIRTLSPYIFHENFLVTNRPNKPLILFMDLTVLSDKFFDTTFALYRLSPLHFSPSSAPLSKTQLQVHADRFHDSLKGDVRRGVTTGLDSRAEITRSGLLKQSRWSLLRRNGDRSSSSVTDSQLPSTGVETAEGIWGIKMEIEYEKTTYTAFVLRKDELQRSTIRENIHLPLLFIHMPTSIRELLIEYLTTTFDTRVEPMRLSSDFLGQLFDSFLETASRDGPGQLEKVVKDVHISFGFKPPVAPSLKSLDVTIQREDISSFLSLGRKSSKSMEHESDVRKAKRRKESRMVATSPFMTALSTYLQTHLALNIYHRDVYVTKVSCGGFLLSRDGKARIQSSVTSIESIGLENDESNPGQKAIARLIRDLVLASQVGTSDA